MNVMHVLGSFGPGGAEIGVVRLINAFHQRHVTHSVCSIGPDLRMKELLVPETKCYTLGIEGPCRTAFVKMARLIKATRTDILHVNNLGPWFDAALASKLAGCKCIETFHGVESNLERFPISRHILWRMADVLTASINAVAISAAELFSRLTGIYRMKVQVIPNGVDTDLFHPCTSEDLKRCFRKDLGLPETSLLFGCIAALRPVKNHEGLIRAFADSLQRHERGEAHLVLVGEGPLERYLKDLCRKKGIDNQVIFIGRRTDVSEILRALDAFVLNSKTEGMSYAILEAMASGLPVIATDVGGSSELLTHGEEGFLVPEGDKRALADYILHVMKNRTLLRVMGEKARKKICNFYSLDKMVETYQKLYEEIHQMNR